MTSVCVCVRACVTESRGFVSVFEEVPVHDVVSHTVCRGPNTGAGFAQLKLTCRIS